MASGRPLAHSIRRDNTRRDNGGQPASQHVFGDRGYPAYRQRSMIVGRVPYNLCGKLQTMGGPVNFSLSPEQQEVRERAARFADREVAPHAAELDREDRVPFETLEKLRQTGFMGLCVPEEYGGVGADFLSYCLLIEELSRADAGVGATLAVHTSAGTRPDRYVRHEEQKARWVPPLARGEGSAASPSPSRTTGSDASAIGTDGRAGLWRLQASRATSSGSPTAASRAP